METLYQTVINVIKAVGSPTGVSALWDHELHVWGGRHRVHGVPLSAEQGFQQARAPAVQALPEVIRRGQAGEAALLQCWPG